MSKIPSIPNLDSYMFSGLRKDFPSWHDAAVTLFAYLGLLPIYGIVLGAITNSDGLDSGELQDEAKMESADPRQLSTAWFVLTGILPQRVVRFIRSCDRSPKKAWDKILAKYAANGQTALDTYEDDNQVHRMQRGHFSDYVEGHTYLVSRIDACRKELAQDLLSDDRKKHFLLRGIDIRDPLWGVAISHARSLPYDDAIAHLEEWDLMLSLRETHIEPALAVRAPTPQLSRRPKVKCDHCKQGGHEKARCFKLHPELRQQRDGGRPTCEGCGKRGHSKDRCFKLHPELRPSSHRPASVSPAFAAAPCYDEDGFAFPSFALLAGMDRKLKLADSACYTHISNEPEDFVSIHDCPPKTVRGLYGSGTYSQRGEAHIWCAVDGVVSLVKLLDCALMPESPFTLISIPKLWAGGCSSEYQAGASSWDFYYRGANFMRADLTSGLPIVKTAPPSVAPIDARSTNVALPALYNGPEGKYDDMPALIPDSDEEKDDDIPNLVDPSDSEDDSDYDSDDDLPTPPLIVTGAGVLPIDRHHQRLGHLSEKNIHALRRQGSITGVKASDKLSPCATCSRVNLNRTSFPTPDFDIATTELEVGDENHRDLTGPITPPGLNGERYLSLSIDKRSRHLEADSIKTKDESFDSFKTFLARSEKQTGRPLKKLWTDRGGEYANQRFSDLTTTSGIIHQFSVPYDHEQNGLIERPMRTVMTVARALLDSSSVPRRFWPEACRHAVYLLNRRPHAALNGDTPESVWSNTIANLDLLRVFGREVWRHVPVELRRKLDDRAERCAFLGVETAGKAYRLWSFERQRVVTAVSVSFNEDVLPFAGDVPGLSTGTYETFVVNPLDADPAPDSVPVPAAAPAPPGDHRAAADVPRGASADLAAVRDLVNASSVPEEDFKDVAVERDDGTTPVPLSQLHRCDVRLVLTMASLLSEWMKSLPLPCEMLSLWPPHLRLTCLLNLAPGKLPCAATKPRSGKLGVTASMKP
jgi:hypothetical protein